MYKNRSKGFTLIELLVVIAIIGILSAVVLASLNSARSKGSDAAVQSNLDGIRAQAELVYSSGGGNCYSNSTTCNAFIKTICPTTSQTGTIFADSVVLNQIAGAKAAFGSAGLNSCEITTGAAAYAIASQLKSDSGLAWCVDSTGQSKQLGTTGTPLTQTSINALITGGKCS